MDNFYETSNRMYNSSNILHANSQFHNSCYLAGYVVECYAKIVIGISYGFAASDLKEFSHDLKKMKREFDYIFRHSSVANNILDVSADLSTIFNGTKKWHPMKRYCDSREEWLETNSNNYQREMSLAMQKIAQIKLDGHQLI